MSSFQMATYDLVLLWAAEPSDEDFNQLQSLFAAEFSAQFSVHLFTTTQEACQYIRSTTAASSSSRPMVVITKMGTNDATSGQTLIEDIRRIDRRIFIILHSHKACADPGLRWYFAGIGVNMVTEYISQIRTVFQQLIPLIQPDSKPKYSCPYCNWSSLSFAQLYIHIPLYHTNERSLAVKCPICQRPTSNYAVHIHEEHDTQHHQRPSATPLYAFALIVCQRQRDNRFLVVQESGSMGFWLPGGRVEVGEQLEKAAERETLEEAGVKIKITGVLKIEFTPRPESNRLRVIFFAQPLDENDCDPKTIPDYESYGAMWLTFEQTEECNVQGQLRGNEPLKWFKYIVKNGPVHPLSILAKSEH